MAAFDYFLRIDGIPGESTDAKHKGEIDVLSFSWGEPRPRRRRRRRRRRGQGRHGPLNVTAHVEGEPAAAAGVRAGQAPQERGADRAQGAARRRLEFLTFSLSDVLVSAYQVGGRDDRAAARLDLARLRADQVEYRSRRPTVVGAVTKAGWDVKANKKF